MLAQLRKYKLDHILFWLLYTLFWLVVSGSISDVGQILNSLIVIIFYAFASYLNIYVLIPLLLQKRKYLSYGLSITLTITLTYFPLAYLIYIFSPTEASEVQQNVWSPGFFMFHCFATSYTVVVTMVMKLLLQWYEREKEKLDLRRLTTETELKYLKSQINPHFLFNCLNSIYSLTLKKSDDAPETVLKLSEMLRYILYEASEKKVTIEKELNYLKNYLELEKIRMGNRGKILFETSTDDETYLIEPMLLMPFVENSFKHGLNLQATDGWVSIVLSVENGKLLFTISNNKGKKGLKKTIETVGGIGIENVRKRLVLLYPAKHTLTISETEEVYKVDLGLTLA